MLRFILRYSIVKLSLYKVMFTHKHWVENFLRILFPTWFILLPLQTYYPLPWYIFKLKNLTKIYCRRVSSVAQLRFESPLRQPSVLHSLIEIHFAEAGRLMLTTTQIPQQPVNAARNFYYLRCSITTIQTTKRTTR